MLFDIGHNEAFESLRALAPGQHWSSFDVPRSEAKKGKARLFVTTIWNRYSVKGQNGKRTPTEVAIIKDSRNGSYWYRMQRAEKGKSRSTHVAHWEGLNYALSQGIPIVGVLKDAQTSRCSSSVIFDIPESREEVGGEAIWVRLIPREQTAFDFQQFDLSEKLGSADVCGDVQDLVAAFSRDVLRSLSLSSSVRRQRLATARRVPERVSVTTSVFIRNPDVVAEVLFRAKGRCEACGQDAPFNRKSDGSPYLEVHHKVTLASGGDDTVENAIAVCPNCHRAAHYA